MNADCGRTEVYAAEAAAFDGTDLESIRPYESLASIVEAVVASAWWPGPPVDMRPARRDAASSSTRALRDGSTAIRLAAEQMTLATAAHELAHALAGPGAGHSPTFLAAYLDVIAVVTNLDTSARRHHLHVDQLRRSFDAAGLTVGQRRWPAPPESTGTAIAL